MMREPPWVLTGTEKKSNNYTGMYKMISLIITLVMLFVLNCASAQGSDTLGISLGELHNDPFHFSTATPEGWLKVAAIGADYARFDIPWQSIEPGAAGAYSLYAEKAGWITLAHAQGLKVVVIVLAGGSYSPPSTVYTNPFDPVAFPNACAWLAKTYLTAGDVIEVLNEPNNSYPGFTGATATAAAEQSLVTFTSNTTTAVHAANPAIRVIGLGAQGGEILAMVGMNPIVDGVVVHPYSNGSSNWPETTYEPPYTDYESWVAALQAATSIPIWETEFAENNGSDAYVRASWLTRRLLMSEAHGIKHWFPHGLVFNAANDQQFLEWSGLDPRMSYYSIQRLFVLGALFNSGVTPVSTLPTVTGANASLGNTVAHVYSGSGVTMCGLWYGGNNINGYRSLDSTPVTVSFPTTLTNVAGSYAMNLVSGDPTPIKVSVASGVATVNVNMSCEATLIVLAPGAATGPLTYNTWLKNLDSIMVHYAGVGPAGSIEKWIAAHPITPDP